jgi:hypothetical protein
VIQEIERYHGAALARLIRGGESMSIRCGLHPRFRSAYVLDERVAMYVKYSRSRLSPWVFGFKTEHRNEIVKLGEDFQEVFIVLVCGFDGVACMSAQEYQLVGASKSVRIARGRRQKYAVSGGGERTLRIGNNEFPAKVFAAIP